MTLSYCWDGLSKPFTLNKFWTKKIGDKILLTTHHGDWVVLSQEEFDTLRFGKIREDPNLFGILKNKGIILTEDSSEQLVETYKKRFGHLFNGTNLHIITTTLECNHRCIYCHAKSKPLGAKEYSMNQNTAKAVVDFIFQTPAKGITIEFQGGEPLVNFPILQYIIEYSKKLNARYKKNITYVLVSNLTLMTEDILDYLIENNVRLCTSLDGPEEIHLKNRPCPDNPNSYRDIVNWINFIKKSRRYPRFSALLTVTKHSLPHAKEIVDEYIKLGFESISIRSLSNAGMASETWNKIGYSADEFLSFWKEALEYIISLNKQGIFIKETTTTNILRRVTFLSEPRYTCFCAPCGAALIQSAYNYNGDVYTCDEARSFDIFRLGNVKEHTYKKIYTSKAAQSTISLSSNESSMCATCVWHPFCGPCLVSTYGFKGTLVPDSSDYECKVRKGMLEYLFNKLIYSREDRKIILKWLR